MDPLLETTVTYEPADSGGVFSFGTHAVVVAVDPETGVVELLDYVVAEDCGTLINPMIVDGQIQGGIAQGIGTALYEEIPFSAEGQPLATTFADYHVPCAPEVPAVRIAHSITPAEGTAYGVKGVGEGGAIAPPAAIANARRRCIPRDRRPLQRDAADAATRVGGGCASSTGKISMSSASRRIERSSPSTTRSLPLEGGGRRAMIFRAFHEKSFGPPGGGEAPHTSHACAKPPSPPDAAIAISPEKRNREPRLPPPSRGRDRVETHCERGRP